MSGRGRTSIRLDLFARAGLAGAAFAAIAGCTVEAAPDQPVALDAEELAVLAVADAALEAITAEDWVAFTDLFLDDGITVSTEPGAIGFRDRTSWLENPPTGDIVERGFDPDVRVSGTIASVWYPYDLYLNGEWSHCGVDIFSMAYSGDAGWRIASLAWSREQPPACLRHPDGPP